MKLCENYYHYLPFFHAFPVTLLSNDYRNEMNDVATRLRLKVRIVHKTNIPKKRNEPASTPVRPVSKKKHFLHVNPFKVLMDEKNTDGDVQRREVSKG